MYIYEATILALRLNCCIQRRGVIKCGIRYKPHRGTKADDEYFQVIYSESPNDKNARRRWVPKVRDILADDWTIVT